MTVPSERRPKIGTIQYTHTKKKSYTFPGYILFSIVSIFPQKKKKIRNIQK